MTDAELLEDMLAEFKRRKEVNHLSREAKRARKEAIIQGGWKAPYVNSKYHGIAFNGTTFTVKFSFPSIPFSMVVNPKYAMTIERAARIALNLQTKGLELYSHFTMDMKRGMGWRARLQDSLRRDLKKLLLYEYQIAQTRGEVETVKRRMSKKVPQEDMVNNPKHYKQDESGLECIEIVRYLPADLANVVKYLWRFGKKTIAPWREDFAKAAWYLEDWICNGIYYRVQDLWDFVPQSFQIYIDSVNMRIKDREIFTPEHVALLTIESILIVYSSEDVEPGNYFTTLQKRLENIKRILEDTPH